MVSSVQGTQNSLQKIFNNPVSALQKLDKKVALVALALLAIYIVRRVVAYLNSDERIIQQAIIDKNKHEYKFYLELENLKCTTLSAKLRKMLEPFKSISFKNCPNLAQISDLPQVTHIMIQDCANMKNIKNILNMQKLEELCLYNQPETSISKTPKLSSLRITESKTSYAIPSLKEVHFESREIDENTCPNLNNCPNFEKVYVNGISNKAIETVLKVTEECKNLKTYEFNIDCNTDINAVDTQFPDGSIIILTCILTYDDSKVISKTKLPPFISKLNNTHTLKVNYKYIQKLLSLDALKQASKNKGFTLVDTASWNFEKR